MSHWTDIPTGVMATSTICNQDPARICSLAVNMNNTDCTALPKVEFFIEPLPDTQRKRRQGEREIGVTRGSYLLLTSLSPSPLPPTHRAPAALPGAALSGHTPPPP